MRLWCYERVVLMLVVVVPVLVAGAMVSCKRRGRQPSVKKSPPAGAASHVDPPVRPAMTSYAVKGTVPGLALDKNHTVGKGLRVANLTVFPIYARRHRNLGKFVTLGEALRAKRAELREVGGGRSATNRRGQLQTNSLNPAADNTGTQAAARVNKLVIVNRGEDSIVVLAGTVVKGGNQDRQIAQDFVVGPKKTVQVDAFCVERGRWNGVRGKKATGGLFVATGYQSTQKVRNAAQYVRDQSKVWSNVTQANRANQADSRTDTLLASLEKPELVAKRKALVKRLGVLLDAAPWPKSMVGLAYAMGGKVLSVRWFLGHAVYRKLRHTLLSTAVNEALTALAAAALSKAEKKATTPARPADVKTFVVAFRGAAAKRRSRTAADNDNFYYEHREKYQSISRIRIIRGIGGRVHRNVPFSTDISAK